MESVTEYKIGQEITRAPDDKLKWLVVRIVERDTALVINDEGEEFITTESYVMLKSEKGEIDFVVLLHQGEPPSKLLYGDEQRRIRALPNYWRKYNGKNT